MSVRPQRCQDHRVQRKRQADLVRACWIDRPSTSEILRASQDPQTLIIPQTLETSAPHKTPDRSTQKKRERERKKEEEQKVWGNEQTLKCNSTEPTKNKKAVNEGRDRDKQKQKKRYTVAQTLRATDICIYKCMYIYIYIERERYTYNSDPQSHRPSDLQTTL